MRNRVIAKVTTLIEMYLACTGCKVSGSRNDWQFECRGDLRRVFAERIDDVPNTCEAFLNGRFAVTA